MGLSEGLHGIPLSLKYLVKSTLIIYSLNFLEKGPVYEINAEAIKISPVSNPNETPISWIELPHLSFSDPKAFTSLWAKSKRVAHLAASARAASFSAIA